MIVALFGGGGTGRHILGPLPGPARRPPGALCPASSCLTVAHFPTLAGSSTGIGMGILRSLAAVGATTVMHGLAPEQELIAKSSAVSQEYGTTVGYSAADLLKPQQIR